MGGFGAYEVLRRRFCINGRKALAAFVEPGMVLEGFEKLINRNVYILLIS